MWQSMKVRLYGDEIKQFKNSEGQSWMYLGLLAIPENQWSHALEILEEDRKAVSYFGEIKSTKLTQRPKIELAKRWLGRVMWDDRKCFHFYILGLNMDNLQRKAFGDKGKEQDRRIYNRFFRMGVTYTLKGYWGDMDLIDVLAIFHDKTEMERDDLFDWHTIWKIAIKEEKITFKTDTIKFIDSDHAKEKDYPDDSHFIQLIDIILGSVRQCLDCTSTKEGITEVAKEFLLLFERLTDKRRCNNPYSRYRYYKRCCIAFFPSRKLTTKDLADPWKRIQSSFFVQRPSLLTEKLSRQQRLF